MVVLLRQGNRPAFEEIYHRYWHPLYAYAYNRLRSRLVCEEIVQEIFVNLWLKHNPPTEIVSLSAFLFTGVKYRMLNEMKAERVRRDFAASFTAFQAAPHSCNTEDTIAEADLHGALQATIAQLPPKCRQIFQLSRNQYQTVAQIAYSLNLSPKTVENQLTKALKHLRVGLGEFLMGWLIIFFNR